MVIVIQCGKERSGGGGGGEKRVWPSVVSYCDFILAYMIGSMWDILVLLFQMLSL